jgi:hypothetical protein
LEEDIETLIKGEKLTGIAGGEEGGDDEEEGKFKDLDLSKI